MGGNPKISRRYTPTEVRNVETSGAHIFYGQPSQLADIAEKIGIELRNRYAIGYAPRDRKRDGRYHRIEVKLVPPCGLPKLTARWRTGY